MTFRHPRAQIVACSRRSNGRIDGTASCACRNADLSAKYHRIDVVVRSAMPITECRSIHLRRVAFSALRVTVTAIPVGMTMAARSSVNNGERSKEADDYFLADRLSSVVTGCFSRNLPSRSEISAKNLPFFHLKLKLLHLVSSILAKLF